MMPAAADTHRRAVPDRGDHEGTAMKPWTEGQLSNFEQRIRQAYQHSTQKRPGRYNVPSERRYNPFHVIQWQQRNYELFPKLVGRAFVLGWATEWTPWAMFAPCFQTDTARAERFFALGREMANRILG